MGSVIFTLTLTIHRRALTLYFVEELFTFSIKIAHGYCQYGRNYVNESQIAKGDVEYYNWSLYSAASQVTGNKSAARPLSLIGNPNFDMRNNVQPMTPCYMVPAAGCNGCNSRDPRNRISEYANE